MPSGIKQAAQLTLSGVDKLSLPSSAQVAIHEQSKCCCYKSLPCASLLPSSRERDLPLQCLLFGPQPPGHTVGLLVTRHRATPPLRPSARGAMPSASHFLEGPQSPYPTAAAASINVSPRGSQAGPSLGLPLRGPAQQKEMPLPG